MLSFNLFFALSQLQCCQYWHRSWFTVPWPTRSAALIWWHRPPTLLQQDPQPSQDHQSLAVPSTTNRWSDSAWSQLSSIGPIMSLLPLWRCASSLQHCCFAMVGVRQRRWQRTTVRAATSRQQTSKATAPNNNGMRIIHQMACKLCVESKKTDWSLLEQQIKVAAEM